MLEAEAKYAPEIFAFCRNAYIGQPSIMFNDHTITSATGTQQGDPLGALLFCITLQPVLEKVTCELNIGYLDDVTLDGVISDVDRDVGMICLEAGKLGLVLNDVKCELISHVSNISHASFSCFSIVSPDNAALLGSPLSCGACLNTVLSSK